MYCLSSSDQWQAASWAGRVTCKIQPIPGESVGAGKHWKTESLMLVDALWEIMWSVAKKFQNAATRMVNGGIPKFLHPCCDDAIERANKCILIIESAP